MNEDLVLYTDRLELVPFSVPEVMFFYELNIDPFIRAYLWDDEIISIDTAKDILKKNDRHFQEARYGLWKITLKGNNTAIGYAGLWYFFDEPQPQLLYALLPDFTGKGFATEAAKRIIQYVFTMLDFNYIIAAIDEGHEASRKVAKRIGMKLKEKRLENGKPTWFYKLERAAIIPS